MALQDLANALRRAVVDGHVTLDRALLTTGTGFTLDADFDELVRAAFNLTAPDGWVLAIQPDQIPAPTGDELRVTLGRSTFTSLNIQNLPVDLRFTPGSGTTLVVTAQIELGAWRFSDSFARASGQPYDQLSYTDPTFIFASQNVAAYDWHGVAALAQGQNFAAMLSFSGLVAGFAAFLANAGSGPYAWIGPIDVRNAGGDTPARLPGMRIRAPVTGQPMTIGALKLANPFVALAVLNVTIDEDSDEPLVQQTSQVFGGFSLVVGDGAAGFTVDFVVPLAIDQSGYTFYVISSVDRPVTLDSIFALAGGQTWGNAIPAPLRSALQQITFKDLQVALSAASPPAVESIELVVGLKGPISGFDVFSIEQLDATWTLFTSGSHWQSTVRVDAVLDILPNIFRGRFGVSIDSNLVVAGGFRGSVHLGDVISGLTGGAIVIPQNVIDFELTSFLIWYDVSAKHYVLTVGGDARFDPFGDGGLALADMSLELDSAADSSGERSYNGSIDATLLIGTYPIAISALYATGQGWTFLASSTAGQTLSVTALLNRLLAGARLPAFLPDNLLTVTNFRIEVNAGGPRSGSFSASAVLRIADISFGPLGEFTANASLSFSRETGGTAPRTSGGFTFDTVIPVINAHVSLGYQFTADGNSSVSVAWGVFTTTYDTETDLLKFTVGEASLGTLLGQIVGLVIGDDSYRLPPPWSVLDQLSLRGFEIDYDLTAKTVSVQYKLPSPIELGFLTINGLTIEKKDKITVALDATFIGGEKVPAFDPLGELPPAPGGPPIDLRLLALGQRVTVPGIEKSKTISDAIKELASFTNTPGSGLPVGPTFSADSPWLVGLHLLVMDGTIEIEIVFVDPLLYGARIHLAGDKAGPFKNLDFEVLYRRVSDSVGVYQIRLTLPDAMRFLQFGSLSITLPIVGIDIYTNGDFKIDFGFPYNMDFSRSFGIQWFPFTGAGGFYLGKLSAATSTEIGTPSVPGVFDPVILFGLGLQVGLGKDISAGILKAGISLTVFGSVEGIIARWVPAQQSPAASHDMLLAGASLALVAAADPPPPSDVGTQYYYKISGTIGIIGKIYGQIDFAIIKASLNLTVTIAFHAVIEAHEPLLVAFTANVSVALSVSIDLGLFSITIHLSFSMTVNQSFTLGQQTEAPWGTLGPPPDQARLAARHQLAAAVGTHLGLLDFQPFAIAADDERVVINMSFTMHPTVASDPADATSVHGKLVAMLYIDAPDPNAAAPALPSGNQPLPPAATSFERFAETVFLWATAAFGGKQPDLSRAAFAATTISRAQVMAAYEYLTSRSAQRPISYDDDIVPGLYPHLKFVVTAGATVNNATPFPMIPELSLTADGVSRRFGDGIQVDAGYLEQLRQYFEAIAARYQNELQKKYNGAGADTLLTARTATTSSYAAAIVEDIVLMLARGMTKAALDVFDAYAWPYAGESLAAIVRALNDIGNAITAAELAAANDTVPLTGNLSLTLTDVRYQFAAADSFDSVVRRFNVPDAGAVVSDRANARQGGVLRTDVPLAAGGQSTITRPGDTFEAIATRPGWSYALLAQALSQAPDAILPLSVLVLPAIGYSTSGTDTLTSVATAFSLDPQVLANDVASVTELFAGTPTLRVPDLAALSPNDLLGRMRAREDEAHLAGANARFLLYGMRPPAPGVNGALGAPTALYDLNWQQIDLPSATTVTLAIDAAQPWITFADGPTPLSVTLDVTAANALAHSFAGVVRSQGVPAPVVSIAALATFADTPRRFTLRQTAILQTTEPLNYPVGNGTQGGAAVPRLWFVPTAMQLAISAAMALPAAFTLEATASGNPPETTAPLHYGWATAVDIEVKRRDDLPRTYEVFGAGAAGTALLEQLITPGATANIHNIRILTGANATGQIPSGYTDPGLATTRVYLVKTNLSTETNPRVARAALRAATPALHGILNDPLDFVRLLWEASVTRNGGFALTYQRDDGSGLPQSIFASGDTATITILILHAANGARVQGGVNAVLVGDGFDPAHYNLAAISAAQPVALTPNGQDSLNDIVARYRVPLTTLGLAAANATLTPAAMIAVTGIVHQVRGPAKDNPNTETLAQIATAYSTTPQAIIDLNTGVSFNPLLPRTVLRIPDLSLRGDSHGSLAGFASAFGVDPGALATANAAVPNIFAAATQPAFGFEDFLRDRMPTLLPGNVGFVLQREYPGDGTDAATILAKQFNLLGFAIADNVAFKASDVALPVGPTKQSGSATRRALHALAAEGPWEYPQAFYAAGSARVGGGDAYGGVGAYAQVAFAPRDMFGNLAASAMTEPTLAPPQPQNDAPLRVAYTDPLLGLTSWPSVGVDYWFDVPAPSGTSATPQPTLHLAATFDVSRYAPDAPHSTATDPNQLPAWQQRALSDEVTYHALATQLAHDVSMAVTTSMDGGAAHAVDPAPFAAFAQAAADWLAKVGAGQAPPPAPVPPPVNIAIDAANPLDLFALSVSVSLARPPRLVDVAFLGTTAERVATDIAPRQSVKDGATTGALTAFASDLEAAYVSGNVFLKVMTGVSQREVSDTSAVWIARLRTAPGAVTDPGIGFQIDGAALYYAPRPLANVAISRGDVPILKFDPNTGVDWNDPIATAFTEIPLDTWGRVALAALDRFLSPDFAGAAFLVDHLDPEKNDYLAKILQLKTDFASDIAETIEPILQKPDPVPGALDAAQETMRQQILAKAENAYLVSAICQYGATVSSPYTDDPAQNVYAPRFYGTIGATAPSTGGASGTTRPWTFTVARPVLAPGRAFVSTALNVVDPSAQSHLPLDLRFNLSNIEHDISKGVDGEYLASSWLSFVIPFDFAPSGAPRIDTRIGAVDIPVVLRAIPEAPALVAQAALPTPDDDPDPAKAFEEAKRWSYGFTYQKDVVAQDTIDCAVTFNTSDAKPDSALAARALDLFDYLGRFVTVWPAMLETMVTVLVPAKLDLDPSSDGFKRAATLVSDFYRLMQPLPAAWAAWHAGNQRRQRLRALLASTDTSSSYHFSVQEFEDDKTGLLVAQRTLGASSARVWDPATRQLIALPPPELTVEDGDHPWVGSAKAGSTDEFVFSRDGQFLPYATAVGLPRRNPIFRGLGDGLDVAAYQNAWSSVRVYRNRDLVRDAHGEVIPTTPDFVYATPEVRFASRVTPILERERDFNVASLSSPPLQPLATHLQRVAALLFEGTAPGTEQFIRFDGAYEQILRPGLPAAVAPIFLGVPSRCASDGAATLMSNAADYIRSWFAEHTPPDGSFRFTLTLFPVLTDSRLPLLRMSSLLLRRADVSDLPPPG